MCQQRKKGSAQGYIRPIQSIVLQPFETFWMDWEMMAISPQTKNQQRAKKVQSIVLWNWSSRSSFGSASRGLLELLGMRNGELSTDKHTQPEDNRFAGAPCVSSDCMSGFKARGKHYSMSREGAEQWPYVELGAAAGGSIGEYFIRAWAKLFPNENIHTVYLPEGGPRPYVHVYK